MYTAEQAAAGKKLYFAVAACHGDGLAVREKATALTGAQFAEAWNGKDRLLEGIETRCRRLAPKSLSAAQYTSMLLTFLLRNAGMPEGSHGATR